MSTISFNVSGAIQLWNAYYILKKLQPKSGKEIFYVCVTQKTLSIEIENNEFRGNDALI